MPPRKIIILSILIVLVIVFPKKSAYEAYGVGGYLGEKHSPCYGYTYEWHIPASDSGSIEYCFGIPNLLNSYCETINPEFWENSRKLQDELTRGAIDDYTFKTKYLALRDESYRKISYTCGDERYSYPVKYYEKFSWLEFLRWNSP